MIDSENIFVDEQYINEWVPVEVEDNKNIARNNIEAIANSEKPAAKKPAAKKVKVKTEIQLKKEAEREEENRLKAMQAEIRRGIAQKKLSAERMGLPDSIKVSEGVEPIVKNSGWKSILWGERFDMAFRGVSSQTFKKLVSNIRLYFVDFDSAFCFICKSHGFHRGVMQDLIFVYARYDPALIESIKGTGIASWKKSYKSWVFPDNEEANDFLKKNLPIYADYIVDFHSLNIYRGNWSSLRKTEIMNSDLYSDGLYFKSL